MPGEEPQLTVSDGRFLAGAQRILDGDDSMHAAVRLQRVVLDQYMGDDRFAELGHVLAMYSPCQGPPYVGHTDVLDAIRTTMYALGRRPTT